MIGKLKASTFRRWLLPYVETLAVWLGWAWIRLVYATSDWHFLGRNHWEQLFDSGVDRPVIVCFWHGRMVMMPCAWQWQHPFVMLGSPHRDSLLIGRILKFFGIGQVLGSSRRGGAEAFIQLCRLAQEKTVVGITPDGPKGPIHSVAPGIVALAKKTNALIVPVSFSVKRKKHLKTWDHFLFPFPFNKGVFVAGEPIDVAQLDSEEALRVVGQALNQVTEEADAWVMGRAV